MHTATQGVPPSLNKAPSKQTRGSLQGINEIFLPHIREVATFLVSKLVYWQSAILATWTSAAQKNLTFDINPKNNTEAARKQTYLLFPFKQKEGLPTCTEIKTSQRSWSPSV